MTPRPPTSPPATEGLVPLGTSLLLPLALVPPTLATAGLTSVALAVVTGLLVGVPAARALRARPPSASTRAATATRALVDVSVLGVLAGTGAALLAPLPLPLGAACALGGWTGAGWLATRDAAVRRAIGVAAASGASLLGVLALAAAPWPVTALDPSWGHLGAVAVPAVVGGLWLGGLGGGQWAGRARPGTARAPWGTAGAAVLGVLGLSLWNASAYERAYVLPTADPATGVVLLLAWLAAASHWLSTRSEARTLPWVGGGLASTAWFAGPAVGVVGLLASGVLPLLVAGSVGLSALPSRGAERAVVAVAAAVAAVAGGLGFAGARLDGLGEAAALGITVVVAFWFVATTLVRRHQEVTA